MTRLLPASLVLALLALAPTWASAEVPALTETNEAGTATEPTVEPEPSSTEAVPAEGHATPSADTAPVATSSALAGVGPFPFEIGFTVKGGPSFSGITKPDDKIFHDQAISITYPGFFGVAGGVGFFLEPRFFDIVSLELGFLWEQASGEGDINDYSLTLTTTDLIIPIHLRAKTPGKTAATFSIGVDLVVPLSSEWEFAVPGQNFDVTERSETTFLGFGIGIEIDAVYVRIPVEFRGRWAAGMAQTYDPRLESYNPYVLKPNWELQGEVLVGVKYGLEIFE